MKIYTKTGDTGETGIVSGKRVSKASSQIESYGEVDELNSFIGWAAALVEAGELKGVLIQIQHDLHVVCADLATPVNVPAKIERIQKERVHRLEEMIDRFEKDLEPLKQFILPGGSELSARLHVCRAVTRRAERRAVEYSHQDTINPEILKYLNRLSDLLFVLARWANKNESVDDILWDQER